MLLKSPLNQVLLIFKSLLTTTKFCCMKLLNFQYRFNRWLLAQPYLSGVSKWVPASAGKAKVGTVHSFSGCTRGVQVKLWRDPLRTHAIHEHFRSVTTIRHYTNPRLPYLYLYWLLWHNADASSTLRIKLASEQINLILNHSVSPIILKLS